MKQVSFNLHHAVALEQAIRDVNKEMGKGIWKALLFHVYSGIEDEEVIMAVTGRLSQAFPGVPVVGTLSAGEIVDGKLPEKGIAASALFFAKTEVQVLKKNGIKEREEAVGKELAEEINAIPEVKGVELLLPGTEFNTRLLLTSLGEVKPGVEIYGGYSGGHQLEQSEHFIFSDDGIARDAVYAIVYAGKDFHINVDKSAGWQQLGMPFRVTKADENRLIEINNAPAVEVYEKYLQINRNDHFAEETFEFPLQAGLDGEELLRHTITVEEDGTLDLAGFVSEGMDIYLSYGNPEDIVSRVNTRLEEIRKFHPEAILLFSCSVRKSFWESFAEIELEPFAKMAPTSGFYTWGEVKRNPETNKLYEYNITMLSIAMREGDAEPLTGNYVVDDSVLKGQASLLKRLSKLVAASTSELQKAYNELSLLNKRLEVMADYDSLTSMYNRRKIEEQIRYHLVHTREEHRKLGTIMLDIDHFKEVNDMYGHAVGDEVLSRLGKLCIKEVKEKGGNLGRWGGEEFFIVLPDYDEKMLFDFAENLRKRVEAEAFPCADQLTISLGVHEVKDGEELEKIYKMTDDALYDAKQAGRNHTAIR